MIPPHDLAIEAGLIGACLVTPPAFRDCALVVAADDFFDPTHATLWHTMSSLWADGTPPEVGLVASGLPKEDAAKVVGLMAGAPTRSSVQSYARRVIELSALRAALGACGASMDLIARNPDNVADTLDQIRGFFADLEVPAVDNLTGLESLDAVVDSVDEAYDWLIPGLLERMDRMVLVAPEGYGKSMIYRQVAVMCGQGIHPFTYKPIPPVRTLLVDLENPPRIIRRTTTPIVAKAREREGYTPDQAWLWSRPGGIDLRSRVDVARLCEVLRRTRPDLVCIGPLYKMFRKREREQDEGVAAEVQAVLDDLRTRFRVALLLEHHAPKEQAGKREMVPFGSSLWLRWPEFGPALIPVERNKRDTLKWGEWRGPRDEREWPARLVRGTDWPWHAIYETAA